MSFHKWFVMGFALLTALVFTIVACGDDDDDDDDDDDYEDDWDWIPSVNASRCAGWDAEAGGAATIYVSTGGSDDNSGDSTDEAFRSLGHALCNAASGQTILIAPGTYNESILLGAFEFGSDPVTIRGDVTGDEEVLLDGKSQLTFGLTIVESSGFIVENLKFKNYTDDGIYAVVSENVEFHNNEFIDNGRESIDPDFDGEGFGLNIVECEDVVVEDNYAKGNGPNEQRRADGTLGTGLNIYGSIDVEVRDNVSIDNFGGGLLLEDCISVVAEDNRFEGNELDAGDWWDGGIWVDGGYDIVLEGNTIRNNHGPGIQISDEDYQYPDASYGYVVRNNTITDNVYGLYIWNFGECPYPDEDILKLSGNDISDNSTQDVFCFEWN